MNKIRASYLFAAFLSFLAFIALLFFAATDSKHALAFFIIAGLLVLNGVFCLYRSVKERRVL